VAEWTTAYINDLPDSAFACIDDAGRHYPHHDESGTLDLPHLRNALSRVAQEDTTTCGVAHLRAHAKAADVGGKATLDDYTAPTPVKAQVISDDHFRLLAIPFGGPIGGKDLDGEYFSKNTDIKPEWFSERPVLWHHGQDSLMADHTVGKATDLVQEDDGWWVDVWMKHGDRRADLVNRLRAKAPLYGSSGTISYLRKASTDGEILVWPFVEQTLTTSPQNALSVTRPAKAWLADFDHAGIPVDRALKAFLTDLDKLGADLPLTSDGGDVAATAGRVLSAHDERALREALDQFRKALTGA
jgi:hypothetical protein